MNETVKPKGFLRTAIATQKFPCREFCPLNRACAKAYAEGNCVEKIDAYIKANVYGTPREIELRGGAIHFTTTNPPGSVLIEDGIIVIYRP